LDEAVAGNLTCTMHKEATNPFCSLLIKNASSVPLFLSFIRNILRFFAVCHDWDSYVYGGFLLVAVFAMGSYTAMRIAAWPAYAP
jgi:hypothetical protein